MAAKLLSMRFCIRSYHAIFSERERERETNLRRHSKRSTACLSNRVECVKHEALAALRKHRRTALAVESPIFLLAYTPVFDVLKSMHCPSPASSPLSEAALLSPFQNVILKGGTAPSEDAAKFDEVAMQCGSWSGWMSLSERLFLLFRRMNLVSCKDPQVLYVVKHIYHHLGCAKLKNMLLEK